MDRTIKFSLIISYCLAVVIFTSRLSVSIRAMALVTSLVLILCTVPPKIIWQTFCHHPIARAAALVFACFVIGCFYGHTSVHECLHFLKIYSPLLWIGFLIAFFRFSSQKPLPYVAIFVHGAVLVTFLGCLNAWHIVDITHLIHSSLTTDPPEYPFGTFCFSLSFASYLSIQQMKYAETSKVRLIYLLEFLFLTFFIFFMNHERTAYILYAVLMLFYGFQHAKFRGALVMLCWVLLVFYSANHGSTTFHHRSHEAVHDVKEYHKGNPISSTGLRLFFIKSGLELWAEKPLFGYGTGSYKETYLTIDGYYMNGEKNTPDAALDQPHNEYVHILIQLGLFGFAFFLWLLFEQARQSFKLPLFEKQCAQGLLLCFLVCSLDTCVWFYATSMTDYFFFVSLFYYPLSVGTENKRI